MKTKESRKNKGITLIALVITIIVLLILAGVTIATLTGNNGILTRAQNAKEDNVVATEEEQIKTALTALGIVYYEPETVGEDYQGLQTELDSVAGKGETIVQKVDNSYMITFSDTGNIYYVTSNYETGNLEIKTEEEYMKNFTYEVADLTEQEREKVEKGFKIDVNVGDKGTVLLAISMDGIIDWGDGTYSKLEGTEIGKSQKIASFNDNISVAVIGAPIPVMHKYKEKNKIFNIKIYATQIIVNSPALQKIIDWGENKMINVNFSNCTNLTEIVSPKENSFGNLTNIRAMFYNCTSLTRIPSDLFDNCPNIKNADNAFYNCTSLTGNAIPLWERSGISGNACYTGCENLTNYSEIPENWK